MSLDPTDTGRSSCGKVFFCATEEGGAGPAGRGTLGHWSHLVGVVCSIKEQRVIGTSLHIPREEVDRAVVDEK